MKAYTQIGIFLLLGVMLVGLLICGCTPTQQTEDTTAAPEPDTDPNAIAFRDLPGVNMDNIDKIGIYYGSISNRKLIQTLDSAEAIAEFQTTFEQFRLARIERFVDTTSSAGVYYTEEYAEAMKNIDAAYCICLQVSTDTQWNVYVGTNKQVYYATPQGDVYISTRKTEYIDALGIGPVLNRSYIEGCAYADIMKSMLDSQIHMLSGEENVTAFFDTFFDGIVLTDDEARINEVHESCVGGSLFQPFCIWFSCTENARLDVSVYDNGALIVRYKDHEFASVQDNVVDKQAMEQWLKEHDAL